MGYYTEYTLEVRSVKTKEDFTRIASALELKKIMYYALDSGHWNQGDSAALFYSWDQVKWYDHEEDMKELSVLFSDFTFCLSGVGEDSTDQWREYYKCGLVERCDAEIYFPKPTSIDWDGAVRSA